MSTGKHTPFFLPYQERWIKDPSRIKIMEKSRQVGMSWATAYSIVRRQSLFATKLDAWVSSRDEAQARLFLEDCKSFSKVLNLAGAHTYSEIIDTKARTSCYTLEFKNKSRIHSLSSNPDAQAGKRGTRILDEFALHPDPRLLYSIAYPGITWGGQLEIISTHRGHDNFFNKLVEEARHHGNPKNISLHRVTLEDALKEGFLTRLREKLPPNDPRQTMDEGDYFNWVRSACPDEETFLQEYMCTPANNEGTFIDYPLITQNEYPPTQAWEVNLPITQKGDYYLGVDIGRNQDLTVFWLVELVHGTFFTRKIITLKDTPFSIQEKMLFDLLHSPHIKRVCIDQTGLGRQFTEQAITRYGGGRVEGINFTLQNKEALAYPLKSALENRSFKIPASPQIRSDFRAIQKEVTLSGNIRLHAQRNSQGHADRFWAAALALLAASTHTAFNHYEPITKQSLLTII